MAWNRNGSRRREDRAERTPSRADDVTDLVVGTPAPGNPWFALSREIDRCRRYRHPLSLVRVAGIGSPGLAVGSPGLDAVVTAPPRREGRPGIRRHHRRPDLAAALRGVLRSGDEAWRHGAAVFVLAPETDGAAAEGMVARIRPVAVHVLGTPVDVRVAVFPEDGITAPALRRALEAREARFAATRASVRHAAGWVALPRFAEATPELREHAD